MAGSRRLMITGVGGSNIAKSAASRLIPKRGQVKLAIVAGLAHRLASMFTVHFR
ncbi:uncharacterized protein J3R85_006841 [Psidium guajava]|nr:uncharacterized protein J3R85_006841 [Psidium guajava]